MCVVMPYDFHCKIIAMHHGEEFEKLSSEAMASGDFSVDVRAEKAPPISFEVLHDMVVDRTIPPKKRAFDGSSFTEL